MKYVLLFILLMLPGLVWPEDVPNCKCVYVPTATATASATATRTATATATATRTVTASPTKTATSTPTIAPSATSTSAPTVTPYPPTPAPGSALGLWQSQMKSFGKTHCDYLKAHPTDWASTYYDGGRVFFQVAEYTGDASWNSCALTALRAYRDSYVLPNGGGVAGWWQFAKGLRIDGDATSKQAIGLLATKAPYCQHTAYETNVIMNEVPGETSSYLLQREVAYCGETLIDNFKANGILNPRLSSIYLEASLKYLDRQFGKKDVAYVKPFMASLGSEFLIRYYEEISPDPRIIPALRKVADEMWFLYRYDAKAMLYMDRCPTPCPIGPGCLHGCTDDPGVTPAADLNQLIAPLYAWLWKMTGDSFYADAADQLFTGGVEQAYLVNSKQWFQQYRWSFDYVKWRNLK